MAEVLVSETGKRYTGVGYGIDVLSKVFAVGGGITLVLMALMSMRSIIGRSFFESPLLGDYELVQMLSAVAIAMTLPYAHWIGAHVIVDFFTAKASVKTNAFMDMMANFFMAFFSAVITWRMVVGMLDLRNTMDASMMLNIPTWWTFVPMIPSFALLTATALYAAYNELGKLRA